MEYHCLNPECKLVVNIDVEKFPSKQYECPNCNTAIFSIEDIKEFKIGTDDSKTNVSSEEIYEALEKAKDLLKKKNQAKWIINLINWMLMDMSSSDIAKSSAMVVTFKKIYPFIAKRFLFGVVKAIIFFYMHPYGIDLERIFASISHSTKTKPLFIQVSRNSNSTYSETLTYRLWKPSPKQLDAYKYIIRSDQQEADAILIRHPYAPHHLIVFSDVENVISEKQINEWTTLLSTLGAKSYNYNENILESRSVNVDIDGKLKAYLIDGKTGYNYKKVHKTKRGPFKGEYIEPKIISLDFIDDLFWTITDTDKIRNILAERFISNKIKHSISFTTDSSNYYGAKVNIAAENLSADFGLSVKINNSKFISTKLVVNFYPLPETSVQDNVAIYHEAMTRLEMRIKQLCNNF